MKLGWREIWQRVSRSSSRVSPRAGGTNSRGVVGIFSGSDSGGPSRGVPGTGVPPLGEPVKAFCANAFFGPEGTGFASLSIVNARKSSSWSFSFGRIVSNIVTIVRRAVCKTTGWSERASWKRYLQPWSRTRAKSEGYAHMRVPDTSNATFNVRRAVRRVESVCA